MVTLVQLVRVVPQASVGSQVLLAPRGIRGLWAMRALQALVGRWAALVPLAHLELKVQAEEQAVKVHRFQ